MMLVQGNGVADEARDYPCDLCGCDDAVEVPYARLYTGDQPIHVCRNCGFVYVRRRRSAQDIADTWSHKIYGKGYTARIPAVKARQTYVADLIDIEVGLAGKSVVDIGAGEGQFLEILRDQYGAEVFGIEPSSMNCQQLAKMGIECFEGTIEQYAASEEARRADVVTVLWTLENCYSCRAMLEAARAIVKESGAVAVATGSRILVPFKKPLHMYLGAERPVDTHCFRFSANTLRGALTVSGLETFYVNRYIDTEYLVALARPEVSGVRIEWTGDGCDKVCSFFERWHLESAFYA